MSYQDFLKLKKRENKVSGFTVPLSKINSQLFDFQKYCTQEALKHGKYALIEECGLGKTWQQLEWGRLVSEHTGGNILIMVPLAVAGQTIEIGERLEIEVNRYPSSGRIQITNYDQIDNIDPGLFDGIILDESSILKNFNGATKKKLIDSFAKTPFKLCCTATPSPNDDMEICNHAEFLNHGRREEILAMYFTHDGGDTSQWRLKGHAQKEFWKFVRSWSQFVSSPTDLGFDGTKFILPKLNLIERLIEVPVKQGMLFNHQSVSATNFNQELRETMEKRLDEAIRIASSSKDSFIIWIKLDKEADYIRKNFPEAIEVHGGQSKEEKERLLLDFAHNKFRVLVTKTKIAQFGLNFQNCHNQIFASLDFSFEGLYQSIRRSYRFGQEHPVNIYMITVDTMRNVIQAIREKQNQFEIMKTNLLEPCTN